jgi:ketosteroid isomerase-like protein
MDLKTTIIALENELTEAFKSNNISTLEKLFHDNLQFVIPTGQTVAKSQDINNISSGLVQITELKTLSQNITIYDESTAVAITESMLIGSFGGQPIQGKFKYSRVWKSTSNIWQVIAGSGHQLLEN